MINAVSFIIIEKAWKYADVKISLSGKDLIPCKVFKESTMLDGNFSISDMFINILTAEVTPKS